MTQFGPPYIITVEAAIGCGKSTFLRLLGETYGKAVKVVYEPVDTWQYVKAVGAKDESSAEKKQTALETSPEKTGGRTDDASFVESPKLTSEDIDKLSKEELKAKLLQIQEAKGTASGKTPVKAEERSSSSSETTFKRKRSLGKTDSILFVEEGNVNFNALDMFYKHNRRFGYAFQGYVLITRIQQIEKVINELTHAGTLDSTLIVVERSWLTDVETFVRLLQESQKMSEIEYRMYKNW